MPIPENVMKRVKVSKVTTIEGSTLFFEKQMTQKAVQEMGETATDIVFGQMVYSMNGEKFKKLADSKVFVPYQKESEAKSYVDNDYNKATSNL